MQAGLSTNEVNFSYGIGSNSKDGNKPSSMTFLHRINQIGGLSISAEAIDASALEDAVTRKIKGRDSVDDTVSVTVNVTDETITEWQNLIISQKTLTSEQALWFQTMVPGLSKAFWFIAEPPSVIPQPEFGQNSLLTVEMQLVVNDFVGYDTKVDPSPSV